ncbi:predicted protein [Histoplasma capsulatum var. duboisii H88]|uniref:Predicted protein n=1 Tax=Ajellomyces capsulatus (strain H88) TaxID=544711 RepID=F0UAR2_AJEC8|nr:predicted protein [Histoplasma capsulatum var. duboisii H88]
MVNPLGGECSMESKAGFLIVDSALEEAEDHSSSHYSHQMQLEAATRGRRHGLRTVRSWTRGGQYQRFGVGKEKKHYKNSFFEIWSFSLAFLHSDSAVSLLEVRGKAAGFCRECDMKNDKSYFLLRNPKRAAMDITWDAAWQGRFRLMIEEDFATSGPMRDGGRENLVLAPVIIPNRLEV